LQTYESSDVAAIYRYDNLPSRAGNFLRRELSMPDAPPVPLQQLEGVRILVTDDEPEMREVFATWLRNIGCEVDEAADGAEALDKLQQTKVDVVVTDVRMPRLDGVGLARQLVDSLEYTPIVIFVSGFHDLPAAEAHDLGIETILSKPCPRKQLVQAVQASLLRRDLQFLPVTLPSGPSQTIRRTFSENLESSGVAIGRGGFSLSWEPTLEPDACIDYYLEFASGPLKLLEGSGAVRWIEREQGTNRLGIEYTRLAENSRMELLSVLQLMHPHSFIPRDRRSARSARTS
jgi:CheY-like chemotaxis protein